MKLIFRLGLLGFFVLFTVPSLAANGPVAPSKQELAKAKSATVELRKRLATITQAAKAGKYRLGEKRFSGCGGDQYAGNISVYEEATAIRLVAIDWQGPDDSRGRDEYYFWDDKLFALKRQSDILHKKQSSLELFSDGFLVEQVPRSAEFPEKFLKECNAAPHEQAQKLFDFVHSDEKCMTK